jgi:hypothetical protein
VNYLSVPENPPSGLEVIEQDPSIVFALDRELQIIYCNGAWDRAAVTNGGATLKRPAPYGVCILDIIAHPLRDLYRAAYLNVFATRREWVYDYECSSATVYRRFQMKALRRPEDDFILVTNFLLEERPHGEERPARTPDPVVYEGPEHTLTMCCLCRRTRRRNGRVWDWVPAYVASPPGSIAYVVCGRCRRKMPKLPNSTESQRQPR